MKLSIVGSTLDFIVALELKPEVKAPAAVQRRWHHRRFLEFGKKAWGRESWFFPFFFFTLWMLIPDKTVISKIGFVDFSRFSISQVLNQMGSVVPLHFCVGHGGTAPLRARPSL